MSKLIKGNLETGRVWIGKSELLPGKSQKIRNHSPSGFSWGYGGSGPAQLALAILLKFVDSETAVSLYQEFKWDIVARWEGDFVYPVRDILGWIEVHKLKYLKTYRVTDRITKQSMTIEAASAQEACEFAGWMIGQCHIQVLER